MDRMLSAYILATTQNAQFACPFVTVNVVPRLYVFRKTITRERIVGSSSQMLTPTCTKFAPKLTHNVAVKA